MKSHARHFVRLLSVNGLTMGIGFAFTILLARKMSVEGYGLWSLVNVAASVAATVALLGVPSILTREVARLPSATRSLLTRLVVPVGAVSVAALVCVCAYLLKVSPPAIGPCVGAAGGLIFLFSLVSGVLQSVLVGRGFAALSSVGRLLAVAGCCVFALVMPRYAWSDGRWILACAGLFGIESVWCVCAFLRLRLGAPAPVGETSPLPRLFSASRHPYAANLISMAINQLPVLLLQAWTSEREVALYGAGGKLMIPFVAAGSALMTILLPLLSHRYVESAEGFARLASRAAWMVGLGLFLVAVPIGFLGRELVPGIFGEAYAAAAAPFSLQVFVAVNLALHMLIGTLFLSANREAAMLRLSMVEAAIMVCGNMVGARHGAFGLALSNWIGMFLGLAIHWWYVRRFLVPAITTGRQEAIFLTLYTIASVAAAFLQQAIWLERLAMASAMLLLVFILLRGECRVVWKESRKLMVEAFRRSA